MSKFNVNLHQVIFSLSDALDLVGVDQIYHGKRVAYIAAECGIALNWDKKLLDDLFLAAILHDCGVSNTAIHTRLTNFEGTNVGCHCDKGADLLQKRPLLASLADYILYHHTPWTELLGLDLTEAVKFGANCIYMADRVDILTLNGRQTDANILASKDQIRRQIKAKAGRWFQYELVDIFLEISASEVFWLSMEQVQNSGYIPAWVEHNSAQEIDFQELKNIIQIFSHIVDAKSSYTAQYSEGVAKLSRYLGELFKLSEHHCDKLELTGLLHDLGMLRVPDKILDKRGKLTPSEYFVVQRHSFDSYDILKNITGFEDIAMWAAQHHERVDGSGYPYRYNDQNLSIEARIIAVAVVFQALTQKRAYRDKLSPQDIISELKQQALAGKLDKDVVLMVENNFTVCLKVAQLLDGVISSNQ
ncbi:MAG: HD domain-containing protein [Methyloprofundus sp.]|nr:HD domain-containing protein [Methyloprofundus sp.]